LDTIAFEKEMQTSLLLRDIPNIGQIVGVTVGKSIYLTSKNREAPDIIHGMLFKYYPGGTIKQSRRRNQDPESWRKWPLQIVSALREIHKRELVHMDLKPSNIVLDTEDNAVIIDFGDQQVTYNWLAPELRDKEDIFMCSLEQKMRGELWTLGKLFSELVIHHQNHTGTLGNNRLSYLATQLMHDDPKSRISLDQVISELERREMTS
jgi:serine/threonine protein kinase